MTTAADREQLACAVTALEAYSEVTLHPGARVALATIKMTLPGVALATIADYMAIWNDSLEEDGRVVWRGEHELVDCEYEVALTLSPEWQPTAEEFFRAVILLYPTKHPERP